ncbi:hypothetical protein [Reinekea sp.]|jgi:hypothetical protein|uniref:hypothetical protein n=1 Tax=Reinekea sp. TaxID=1970455 RepID=UPI003988B0FC
MDEKLKNFKVSSNGDLDLFWSKLTSENGWSLSYAKEVFSEYKKFVWLAKNSRSRVVPSKAIDRVWHLHMTFTKSYWHDLCTDVLNYELHHIPSSKNSRSEELDRIGYKNTLRLYEAEFGVFPPAEFWPDFSKRTFNRLKYLVFPFFTVTFLTACSLSSKEDFMTTLKWGLGIYIGYRVLKWLSSNSGSGGSGCGSGCGSSCGGD